MTGVHHKGNSSDPGRLEFERTMLSVRPMLLRFALYKCRNHDEAEDLVQRTCIKALVNWEKFQPGTNMIAWLRMILRNDLIEEKRRSWRRTELDQGFAERIVDLTMNQEEKLGLAQEFTKVVWLLARLEPQMRDSLIGIRYLGMRYQELAEATGCVVGTAKSRVARATAEMRRLLKIKAMGDFDLSHWAHATKDVSQTDPYFPIAKAYEDIYAFVVVNESLGRGGASMGKSP